jgi:pSer/pThr/pTyr-binding forkhead associated (FHA) protein
VQFYIQDTKSSSGTYLNNERLSPQAMESPAVELHENDIIKLGEDYNLNGGAFCRLMEDRLMPIISGPSGDSDACTATQWCQW